MMMGFGLIGLLLLGGVVIALLIGGASLLRQFSGPGPSGKESERTARRLLDERLARGEVTLEEYEAIRATLER
jgi:uncharacterized membrane protein